MFSITISNHATLTFQRPVCLFSILSDINKKLAEKAIGAIVNGHVVDIYSIISENSNVSILTDKDHQSLEILRHSCAHLLAQAVKQLFPGAQPVIGPVVQDGFYYDFCYSLSFTEQDLQSIEERMFKLARQSQKITKHVKADNDAIAYFRDLGEPYKVKIVQDLISKNQGPLTFYSQGDFTDLCRGPHVPNTSFLKSFKLIRVTGAYWQGNSKNEMLQRIYGTCWPSDHEMKEFFLRLEQIKKRDHRKIGKDLELFHFQNNAPGFVFWHHNGVLVSRTIEEYMRESNRKFGCIEIKTPLVLDTAMWEKSGHMSKYSENIFFIHSESRSYAIRPMNCPTCIQVYNNNLYSYKDLPVRITEFGVVHRNEPSGSLHGLFRLRSFTQDDGHVFCTNNQIETEVRRIIDQCFQVYHDFGFSNIDIKLSLRPEQRVGSDEIWDKAETALAVALKKHSLSFQTLPGEGAFYGPKIEFHLRDAIGRAWQCGTIQLDFSMPKRLGATYIDDNGQKQVPVMLHRAIVGSLERFIGILIEHYSGKLPVWLAPVQVILISLSCKQHCYIQLIHDQLLSYGIRASVDLRDEKIGFKIRQHSIGKVPFIGIIGAKEESVKKISLRRQDGKDFGLLTVEELKTLLYSLIQDKL